MSIEDLKSKTDLMRFLRDELETEPLPQSAIDGLSSLVTPGRWVELNLENGWANFGGIYAHAASRTIPGGGIQLRGEVTKATAFNATRLAKLPVGPKEAEQFATSVGAQALAVIEVKPNGEVIAYGETAESIATGMGLTGVIFWPNN